MSIQPRFDATSDNGPGNGHDALRAQKRSKPGFAITAVLLSLGVAIVVFAAAIVIT